MTATILIIQIAKKPRRPAPDGAVPCLRKGPLEDFIAWERCLEMRGRNIEACGSCQHHRVATVGAAAARAEDTRQRWSKQ